MLFSSNASVSSLREERVLHLFFLFDTIGSLFDAVLTVN